MCVCVVCVCWAGFVGDAVADFWTVEQQHDDDMPFGMRVCNFAKGYQGLTLIILPVRELCC